MTFYKASVDWFLGKQSAHMGPNQYVAHKGMRDGKAMSGDLLWAESEAHTVSASGNMVNAETNLLHNVAEEIGDFVPTGITIVDLGPGTATAFRNKTLPLLQKLGSQECILVDESIAFLKQIADAKDLGANLSIKPVVDDFFENEEAYLEAQALVCSFGSTISNFVGPVSEKPPQDVLVSGLTKMAHAANNGWMLAAFDSDQDGEHIKAFYRSQEAFQLNIFDRVAAELPVEGDFDPKAFHYEPIWIASSGQLAHTAIVSRDMKFKIGSTEISLKQGQKLHIKNSYKFTPSFFEHCCSEAGLEVIKSWSDNTHAKVYLLKLPPKRDSVQAAHDIKTAEFQRFNVA